MGKLTFVFILLFSIQCFAQDETEIPKKTWKIIIKNKLSAEENFMLVGQTLIANDYTIENKDKDFFTIKTGLKLLEKTSITYFFTLAMKNGEIILSGQNSINMTFSGSMIKSENVFYRIENKSGLNEFKKSFDKMNNFALRLGKSLEYIGDETSVSVELITDEILAFHGSGVAKYLLKDYVGAVADLTKVLDADQKQVNSWYYRGLSQIQLGNKDGGCYDLIKASALGCKEADISIKQFCK